MTARHRKGDRVRVVVEGNLMYDADDDGLSIDRPGGGFVYMEFKDATPVIERLEPAGWPPAGGDLWRHGATVLFVEHSDDDPMFRDKTGNEFTAGQVLNAGGSLVLLHREPKP